MGAAALLIAVTLTVVGCGEEASDEPAPPTAGLTGEERRLIDVYEHRIQAHCVRVARSLLSPRAAPSPRQEARAFAAADALVALAERKPAAPVGPGQDLRLLVSDIAENLEGSNCDPRMIARLERGLAGIPAG